MGDTAEPLHPSPPPTSSPPTQHVRHPASSPTGREMPSLPTTVPRTYAETTTYSPSASGPPTSSPKGIADFKEGLAAGGGNNKSSGGINAWHGGVRRNIEQQSNTFAIPFASVTSPPASRLMGGSVSPLLSMTDAPPFAQQKVGAASSGPLQPDHHTNGSPVASTGLPGVTAVAHLPPVTCVKDAIAQARSAQPPAPPAPSTGPSVLPIPQQAAVQQGARTIFCLFGSLERRISILEVRDVFSKHRVIIEPFFQEVQRIDSVFPPDINFMELLKSPTYDPKHDEFFSYPMTIWPLTTLYLVACFLVTARKVGYQSLFAALQEGGLLMVGKGVFAALAVAESRTEEELIKNTSRQYRAAFCVGIAYNKKQQEVAALSVGCVNKGFSMLVVNIPINTLQLLIDQANNIRFGEVFSMMFADKNLASGGGGGGGSSILTSGASESIMANDLMAPHSEIQITRVISERSAVIVAHPLDLMRLDMLLVKFADETGIKIHKDFLPTPVPENSPFFNQGLQYELCRIWLDMDFTLECNDLVIPIFSPQNGGELKMSPNLLMDIAAAVTCVPQDLTYSLQNLRDGDVLLDYSPSSMRLGQIIAWTRRNIVCLAEPSDRVEASILPSPRRSARGDLICKTLGKCAEIQEIVNHFHWEHKPPQARIAQLSTSFITDWNLLIDLDNVALLQNGGTSVAPAGGGDLRSPDMSITSFPLAAAGRSSANHPAGISSPRAMSLLPRVGSMLGGMLSTSSPPHASITNFGPNSSVSAVHHHHTGQTSSLIHAGVLANKFVVLPSAINKQVMNLYEVSPLIKYLEMQHRCVLTRDAVELADRLSRVSGLEFPPHTLLLCPTILQLLEFWDGLEFLQRLTNNAISQQQEARDAPPGMPGAAVRRRRQLKRATDLIYGSTRPAVPRHPPHQQEKHLQ